MISLSSIALVASNPDTARLVVDAASLCFDRAVWQVVPSVEQLTHLLDAGERFRLILIDVLTLGKESLSLQLDQLTCHPRLFATPVLLLANEIDQPILRGAYEAGVSACHSKPHSAAGWKELLTQIHRYWFMINMVPPRRLLP